MITSLKISNYALIEHLDIAFDKGMTCITGETGAGKSILMGGLALVLGKRADLSALKDNNKKCIVEASFLINNYNLKHFFEELELDYEEETILRREIIPSGKSRAFINDTPVTLDVVGRLSAALIDIHSQLENQSLFRNEYQFLVLDALAGNSNILVKYKEQLQYYQETLGELNRLKGVREDAAKIQDYNQFLYNELVIADLTPSMMKALEEEIEQLSNVSSLQAYLSQSIQLVEEEQMGLLTQLSALKTVLNDAANQSKKLNVFYERVNSLLIELKDVLEELFSEQESLESNPQRLEILTAQWDRIQALFQKHGVDTIDDLIKIKDKLERELAETQDIDDTIAKVNDQLSTANKTLNNLAQELHNNRKKASPKLCKQMELIISKMGMENARFKVDLAPSEVFLANGKEQINFLFSANLGSEFKPLKKVASGGEMSRIMLSIKAVLSQFQQLPTIVFDEIDTGVSGTISNEVGSIMSGMSENMQVFTITHLPQVAAKGKQHFKVYKEVMGNTTITKLKELNREERIKELAQMLSGKQLTQTAMDHARQLLN